MIRHSSSFFISLIFHTLLFIAVVFVWNNYERVKKVECEKKLCVQLHNVVHEKPVVKPPVKPKPKPKPKKIIKPKVKPKPVVKKVEIVKEKPVVIPEIVEEEVVEEVQEEEPVQVVRTAPIVEEEIVEEEIIEEDLHSKQERLEQDYLQEHIARITKLLQENLYYPRRARKRGIVGEVMVKFKLSTDATAHSIEVLSSKSEILSRAAIKTIKDLSGEFPKPSEELTLHVPINYALKR